MPWKIRTVSSLRSSSPVGENSTQEHRMMQHENAVPVAKGELPPPPPAHLTKSGAGRETMTHEKSLKGWPEEGW